MRRRSIVVACCAAVGLAPASMAQGATSRGYELVSPADSGGADVMSAAARAPRETAMTRDPWSFSASPDGERLIFGAQPNLPGSDAAGQQNQPLYRARRRADLGQWVQDQVSPPGTRVEFAIGGGASEDLELFSFDVKDGPVGTLHPDDPGPAFDSYLRQADGSWTWASRNTLLPDQYIDPDGPNGTDVHETKTAATSPDGRTPVFLSRQPLEPEAGGLSGVLYAPHPDGDRAEVVSIVDDPTGPAVGNPVIVHGGSRTHVSEDGQRILFGWGSGGGGPSPSSYSMRLRDEQRTVEVTAAMPGGSTSDAEVVVLGMARDGSAVYFETAQALTADDADDQIDLFRFDVASETLERVSAAAPGAPDDGQRQGTDCDPADPDLAYGVSGCAASGAISAPDGSVAYFIAPERLVAGAVLGAPNLYVRRIGEPTRLVATLHGGTGEISDAGPLWIDFMTGLTVRPSFLDPGLILSFRSRPIRITGDGSVAFFTSHAQLTDYDNGEVREAYVFDERTGEIECASCATLGANENASLETQTTGTLLGLQPLGGGPGRNMTADGTLFHFDTEEKLVAGDVNGARDVYEYDATNDSRAPISSGHHPLDSVYLDTSEDGRDVFFITRERLVAQDRNGGSMRIYDARRGGGFATPEPLPPCAEGGCRVPGPGPAEPAAPAGGDGSGAGDVRAPRRTVTLVRPLRIDLKRAARSGHLTLRVRTNKGGIVRVRAVTRVAGRVTGRQSVTRRVKRSQTMRVRLRLSPPARRALSRGRRVTLRVVASAPNALERSTSITLRRAGR
jgi:hypothetical protein